MGEFDYFYPHNSDQYAFYRIPKRLFTDRDLKTMTNGSKILYGLLLDRVDLSARNRWIDEAIGSLSFIQGRKSVITWAVHRRQRQNWWWSLKTEAL